MLEFLESIMLQDLMILYLTIVYVFSSTLLSWQEEKYLGSLQYHLFMMALMR